MSQQCFVQPGQFCIIDVVDPATGRSSIYGETLEQVQARYPGAVVGDLEEWYTRKIESFLTEPEEITEEQYDEMLNVLPPKRWEHRTGPYGYTSSFEMIEHMCGSVTAFYIAIETPVGFVKPRYFTYQGHSGVPHEEKIKRVVDKFNIQPL